MNDEEDLIRTDLPWTDPEGLHGPRVVAAIDGSAGSPANSVTASRCASRRSASCSAHSSAE